MAKLERVLTDDLWSIIEPVLPKQKATKHTVHATSVEQDDHAWHTLRAIERLPLERAPQGLRLRAQLLNEV